MARLKFKSGDVVKGSKRAPLYLKAKGECTIGEYNTSTGKYDVHGPDGTVMHLKGEFMEFICSAKVEEATKETFVPKTGEVADFKEKFDGSNIDKDVIDFVNGLHTKNEALQEEINQKIAKELNQIVERQIIANLAIAINKVPSPRVYAFMNQLVEIQPEFGSLPVEELYNKAESTLQNVMEV